ncbi:MAG: ester cyclase [Caldilineales bacterium]|nr:ester cyclase [Caldilineales bacterium]
MSTTANKALVRRLIEDGINQGDYGVIEELVAPDFQSRGDETMTTMGTEGFKELVAGFRAAFPDGRMIIEEVIAEDDTVITWSVFTGTNTGPLEGIPPTGKTVRVKDVDLFRISNGMVIESWAHFDQLGMLHQLGVISV